MTARVETSDDVAGSSNATPLDGWTRVPLCEIADVVRGVTYKKAQACDVPEDGTLPLLRATNIQDGRLVLDADLVHVPSELMSGTKRLREGDIVVATSSGSKHLVGKTAQLREPWEGSFGAFCAAIRAKSDINHRYFGYFFETREYKDYIAKQALGVNINNLRRGDLEQISVPVAPRSKQESIVAEIEKQFSRLDEAVANLKRVKANLKRYKAAVLKAAVEGKLTEEWRAAQGRASVAGAGCAGATKAHPDIEPASKLLGRILTERGAKWEEAERAKMEANGKAPKNEKWKVKYKAPSAPDTADLPELQPSWMWAMLGSILSSIEAGKSFKCEERPPREGEVGVVKVSAVTWGEFDEAESKTCLDDSRINETLFVRTGDFLFSRANTIELVGACVIAKEVVRNVMLSDKILRFELLGGFDEWVLYVLRSMHGRAEIERLATGNQESMRNIGQERIRAIRIPLPPITERDRIVAEVERHLSLIGETDAQVDTNLKRAERLRQSILSQAFSGRLIESAPDFTDHHQEAVR